MKSMSRPGRDHRILQVFKSQTMWIAIAVTLICLFQAKSLRAFGCDESGNWLVFHSNTLWAHNGNKPGAKPARTKKAS
jgi:hypothetical protein